MPTLLWYPYCLYYYYILTRFKILVPVLLWYSECLSYSYIHSAYLIMIFIKNSKKKLICAFFITTYRVPALLLYVECLLYYNLPYFTLIQCWQKISILSSREERRFLYFNHLSKEFLEQMIPHLKALI